MKSSYKEINGQQPKLIECFFAFDNKQFDEGVKKMNLQGVKLYQAHGGLFGTNKGITSLLDFYKNKDKEIESKCCAQDAYNYEFANHECDYVGNDGEAIKIIVDIFGKEKAKTVNRRYGYLKIDSDS